MSQKTKYVAVDASGLVAGATAFMALFFMVAGGLASRSECDTSGFGLIQCQGEKIESMFVDEAEHGTTLTFTDGTAVLFVEECHLEIEVKKEKSNTPSGEVRLLL